MSSPRRTYTLSAAARAQRRAAASRPSRVWTRITVSEETVVELDAIRRPAESRDAAVIRLIRTHAD